MDRRAFFSRSQSADVVISREINLRELENAETREMRNKSISEMFETNDVSTMNPKDGLFMIRNEGLVSKRHHQSSITKVSCTHVEFSAEANDPRSIKYKLLSRRAKRKPI